ncbi:ADC synthase [Phyllosticta citricarpa]|uniref:aminodeoxychorismate synthase n=1 Tax=Phyllosticta citricarpa TaxID=55181 RepID=A0ABR1LK24_9PEZI
MAKDDACHAPRILCLDAYDSFANNIVSLLRQTIGADVTTIHIDDPRFLGQDASKFSDFVGGYDAVVAGPGPGTVTDPDDVGLISCLWSLPLTQQELPVLGICLGFQSLAHAYGAAIEKLPEPRHGIITRVQHQQSSIFGNVDDVHATQYHSLRVKLHQDGPHSPDGESGAGLWKPSQQCPKLRPIAWDLDSAANGPVLMGVEHMVHPFWGVQYHPESICTNPAGARIIRNWWNQARKWLDDRPRKMTNPPSGSVYRRGGSCNGPSLRPALRPPHWDAVYSHLLRRRLVNRFGCAVNHEHFAPAYSCDVKKISSLLGLPRGETIILESGLNSEKEPIRAETGSHSVLCCLDPDGSSLRLEYYIQNREVQLWSGNELLFNESDVDVWAYLKDLTQRCRTPNGPAEVPFWGGLAGIISYEAGLETINVDTKRADSEDVKERRPDILFAFVLRSIVVNHVKQTIHVQSIEGNDEWVQETAKRLKSAFATCIDSPPSGKRMRLATTRDGQHSLCNGVNGHSSTINGVSCATTKFESPRSLTHLLRRSHITTPTRSSYTAKVATCHDHIRAGNSYELCLTAPTTVRLPQTPHSRHALPWHLYTRLRRLNPAPFGAYMRLAGATVVSSSPERFLSWNRNGRCQFRPIKGTVKKTRVRSDGSGAVETVHRAEAERILGSAKERAENLMIVDLVRHDLHGVAGAGNVWVSKLMGVEEYETVWQLVSVVEGQLGNTTKNTPSNSTSTTCTSNSADIDLDRETNGSGAAASDGVVLLAASLPPGSMTGAPKKRSCELLSALENGVLRGVYSGVMGYLDVGGGGDFAVVIRTAFRWDEENHNDKHGGQEGDGEDGGQGWETWTVGAGGAVTAQSDPHAEYDEMRVKLDSIMRMFDPGVAVDDDDDDVDQWT